jgi:hypothetical protein
MDRNGGLYFPARPVFLPLVPYRVIHLTHRPDNFALTPSRRVGQFDSRTFAAASRVCGPVEPDSACETKFTVTGPETLPVPDAG